jgi:hypothetical protein
VKQRRQQCAASR